MFLDIFFWDYSFSENKTLYNVRKKRVPEIGFLFKVRMNYLTTSRNVLSFSGCLRHHLIGYIV